MLFKRKSITTAFGPVPQQDYNAAVDSLASRLVDQTLCAVGDQDGMLLIRLRTQGDSAGGASVDKLVGVYAEGGLHLFDFPLGMWPWFQAFLFQRLEGGSSAGHIKVQCDNGRRKMLYVEVEYLIDAQYAMRIAIRK